jgi:UDP-N-acetylmuramoyl-tripeptide--D-alanyl-D-alanine ligase
VQWTGLEVQDQTQKRRKNKISPNFKARKSRAFFLSIMQELFELFNECSGVSIDTRRIEKNNLFIALSGPNFDGNQFAKEALEKGAKYAIVDKTLPPHEKIFQVENTLVFLQELARFHRNKFKIPLIGITGSNGKTTSKELLNAVLSSHYKVLCTQGNLNNHIGVPLTLLQIEEEHDMAIIEMGANKLKDIEELCHIASPNYGYITNIGRAHLEGFINLEGVINTKSELMDAISNIGGTFILNASEEIISIEANKRNINRISFGNGKESLVQGEITSVTPYLHLSWKTNNYQSPEIITQLVGGYNLSNILAAITFGLIFNVPKDKINHAIESYQPNNNRSQITKTERNTLLVDCYNANPSSMMAALENFKLIQDENKMAILGDMLELGEESLQEHLKIIAFCNVNKIKRITVGPIFYAIDPENSFKDVHSIGQEVSIKELNNYFILLKGSRGIALEKLIALL